MIEDPKIYRFSDADELFTEGMMCYSGIDSPLDYEKAFDLFRSSRSLFSKIMLAVMFCQYRCGVNCTDISSEIVRNIDKEDLIFDDSPVSMLIKGLMYRYGLVFKKNNCRAFDQFRISSRPGNAVAQYFLGMSYLEGAGIYISNKDAFRLLRKAAEQGYAPAQNELGRLYALGTGTKKSLKKANRWMNTARRHGLFKKKSENFKKITMDLIRETAEHGSADFKLSVYLMMISKDQQRPDDETLPLLIDAAEQGSIDAMKELGYRYLKGRGVERSEEKAERWFTEALGRSEYDLILWEIDEMHYLQRASELGFANAQYRLGCILLEESRNDLRIKWDLDYRHTHCRSGPMPPEVLEKKQEAMELFRKAAEQGHSYAMYDLGDLLIGSDDEHSVKMAIEWYIKSAELGCDAAIERLYYMYYHGIEVEQSYEKALGLYLTAAQRGDTEFQFKLGYIYSKGNGVEKSYEEPMGWDNLTAENNDALYQFELEEIYSKGNGVEKSYEEAMRWYKLAAENDNPYAQYEIGKMYLNGTGVRRSYKEASKWIKMAAENGASAARSLLGDMYLKGKGVRQSVSEARRWHELHR